MKGLMHRFQTVSDEREGFSTVGVMAEGTAAGILWEPVPGKTVVDSLGLLG